MPYCSHSRGDRASIIISYAHKRRDRKSILFSISYSKVSMFKHNRSSHSSRNMKFSAPPTISTAALLLLLLAGSPFGPALAAREASTGVEMNGGGRDSVPGQGTADLKADEVAVKHSNSLLRSIYDDWMAAKEGGDGGNGTDQAVAGTIPWGDYLVWRVENGTSKLLVEVTAQGEGAEALLQPAFEAFDFESTGCSTYQCSGFLPIENVPGFEARPEVRAVRPSMPMTAGRAGPPK